jgi:hypothetical protein
MRDEVNELKDTFADAVNASGKALEKILRFLITLLMTIVYGLVIALRSVRTWLDNGAKVPDWMVPGATFRKQRQEAQ